MSIPQTQSSASVSPSRKRWLIAACVIVIGASAWWTYRTQFASPRTNAQLHAMIGRILAEETTKLLNGQGKIVIISIDTKTVPELKWQLDAFQKALDPSGRITVVKTYDLETEGKTKFGFGSGLSGRRYIRTVNKNEGIAAVVSFAGAPNFKDHEEKELKFKPKLIAESRSPAKLKSLFAEKLIDVAIVSRFEFPNPISGRPKNARELFIQRFQVVTPENAEKLPAGTEE